MLCKYLHNKAEVENHVRIIYNRVYAQLRNETFYSIESLNQAIGKKVTQHNQTRMQQKPYSREEKFLAEEKALLQPLPDTPFQIKYYTELKVGHNNYIYLGRDKHSYSVPYSYIGQKVSVIYTRTIVQIYCNGTSIATHPRSTQFGYTTLKEHLCSSHKFYLERSPEYYIKQAQKRSQALALLITASFEQESVPERLYKRCDGLLSLQRKTDPLIFEKACKYALEHQLLGYKSLIKIIQHKTYQLNCEEAQEENTIKRSYHQNIRGKEYYTNQF